MTLSPAPALAYGGGIILSTHSTGQPKYVLYVEGSGYQMGYLVGLLAPEETFTMV